MEGTYKLPIKAVSIDDILNLRKPTAEEMKWCEKAESCIFVLCKDRKDSERMATVCKGKSNNRLRYIWQWNQLYGLNGVAIIISQFFDNERMIEEAEYQVLSRCGGHPEFKQIFEAREQ